MNFVITLAIARGCISWVCCVLCNECHGNDRSGWVNEVSDALERPRTELQAAPEGHIRTPPTVVVLDIAVLGLSVLPTHEVRRSRRSTSPPVAGHHGDDRLDCERDERVG